MIVQLKPSKLLSNHLFALVISLCVNIQTKWMTWHMKKEKLQQLRCYFLLMLSLFLAIQPKAKFHNWAKIMKWQKKKRKIVFAKLSIKTQKKEVLKKSIKKRKLGAQTPNDFSGNYCNASFGISREHKIVHTL